MNRYIARAVIIAGATFFAVPAWAVNIAPCSAPTQCIQNAISSNPAGTTFNLGAGTFTGQVFNTKSNITLQGAGAASTILNGGGTIDQMTNGNSDGATGVIIDGVTIRNYGASSAQFVTWNGWIVRNSTLRDSATRGIYIEGAAQILNNLITNNGHGGVEGVLNLTGSDTVNHATISGNEISFNNPTNIQDFDASGLKILFDSTIGTTGTALDLKNNYVHDNHGPALWCDGYGQNWTIQGNTLVNNYDEGIMFETCNIADISGNVINNSGINHVDNLGSAIYISSSGNANVHDNNVLVGVGHGNGINIQEDTRGDDVYGCVSDTIHNNTVTFLSNGGGGTGNEGLANYRGCAISGDFSNNNSFFVANLNDAHWSWPPMGQYSPATFSAYRSQSGHDSGSTIQFGNASVPGCMHIGCTGSGWPVANVPESPFGGAPRAITSVIQAEDYDLGGQSVAYSTTNGGSTAGASYRTDAMNIYTTTDTGSGLKIGYQQPGDYYKYTVTVASTGIYTLKMRVANIETGASYHVAIDGVTVVSGITVPNTGSYDMFATVTSGQFGLTAGQHIMQIVLDTAGPLGFGGDRHWAQATLVSANGACTHYYNGSIPVASNYAAAYDVFDPAKSLLATVDCTKPATSLVIGPSNTANQYIYKTAYLSTNGTSWSAVNLSSANAQQGNYFPRQATANLNLSGTQLQNWNYIAFLVATQSGNGWKYGCVDATCSTPKWNLQAIHQ